MAEMIKPKKEDIVVFGRIVSASTEGVVANAEQIYDGVSNIRQYEINKKFLSGNYTIGESNIKDKSITTDKLADDVWKRLKNEYLRLDGNNSMSSPLKMGGNSIKDVSEISSDSDSPVFINLLNNEVTIGANDDEDNGVPVGQWATIWRDSNFYGNVEAKGFKTHDSTNIGFLVNDGSVGLAMTDSDIDGLFQQVFQTVIG